MNDDERDAQQSLHEAIAQAVAGHHDDDDLLVGWIVVYETTALSGGAASAGHFYGPHEMTTWRALGLIEWARRWSLEPGTRDE